MHRLIMADTVETQILDLQARKWALADALFDEDANGLAALSEDGIATLFAWPLGARRPTRSAGSSG
jgi:SNF2 family DNA or RNA helicase